MSELLETLSKFELKHIRDIFLREKAFISHKQVKLVGNETAAANDVILDDGVAVMNVYFILHIGQYFQDAASSKLRCKELLLLPSSLC